MSDILILAAVVLAFALFATTHVALSLALARSVWWQGAIALFTLLPAPYLGFRAGMRARSAAWMGTLFVYLVALGAALHGR